MELNTDSNFEEISLEIHGNNLMDLGVVDFNNDGNLDIFTTSHHSMESLLKNDGQGNFHDVRTEMGLDQQPEFPYLEISDRQPDLNRSGFYIYWQNSGLVLQWIPDKNGQTIAGEIILSSDVILSHSSDFYTNIQQVSQVSGIPKSVLNFSANNSASLTIKPEHIAIPIKLKITNNVPLEKIYVGQKLVHPSSSTFTMFLNDRHGMAWADYNADGRMDVFITRGGLKGKMNLFTETFSDELMEMGSAKFRNVISNTGILKSACPGYNVQWVDYNRDNLLDLYISCHHGSGNQLHKNEGNGTFTNVAAKLGVDFSGKLTDTPFVWLDTNNDNRSDLIVASDDGLKLFINNHDKFEYKASYPVKGISRILINDYDLDDDLDLFLVSYTGMNSLLVHEGSDFSVIPAGEIGLPAGSITASWVDFDNDSRPDLHVLPGGIFRQNPDHSFSETGLLKHTLPWFVKRARLQWFDMDNDGDRDLVLGINYEHNLWKVLLNKVLGKYTPDGIKIHRNWEWKLRVFENKSTLLFPENRWLQLDLQDSSGNPQAIGSLASLHFADNRKVIAQVGQADDSLLSQGHYRLYFGFGNESNNLPTSINITWPDGKTQKLPVPPDNERLTVTRTDIN